MRRFCSLADFLYLPKLLVLYESLRKHSSEPFQLHVLAMCERTEKILIEMNLPGLHVIPLRDFEKDMGLVSIRQERSWKEFCWTCASQLMEYMLPLCDGTGVTYLDADLMFFADPEIMFDEMAECAIGITPHRFNDKDRERLGCNGEFNVGVLIAANDGIGRACIARWAAQCRERCSETIGCGDQQYLDEWPSLYGDQCHIIENLGVNLGPWSVGNFSITPHNDLALVNDDVLACYHFHEFRSETFLTGWPLRPEDIELIYKPYIAEWQKANERIREVEAKIGLEAEWERA